MKASQLLWHLFGFLIAPALISTLVLYNYPFVFGCAFPKPPSTTQQPLEAPFRLLALGDPQLEGDTSLPDPHTTLFPSLQQLFRSNLDDFSRGFETEDPSTASVLLDLLQRDIPNLLKTYRKRLDLLGNDYYLAHIYRTLQWWLNPTHVTVLGDLLGSQWIADEEFEKRRSRFWSRAFNGGLRVDDKVTEPGHGVEELGADDVWKRVIINVVGNHDIGYAGDITRERVDRFERAFGKVNWNFRFTLPNTTGSDAAPEIHLVVLNDMNLDAPAYDNGLTIETYNFLNDQVIAGSRPVDDKRAATIVLTHIPLHKKDGLCVDGPSFEYGPTGIREQNQLSERSSRSVLEGIFGVHRTKDSPSRSLGRNGVILTGHDHEGCDVYHYFSHEEHATDQSLWGAKQWRDAAQLAEDGSVPGVREITVRSMMGSFGGNAGLLSAWFDDAGGEWHFEYNSCMLGVQHMWWAVHVVDLVTLAALAGAMLLRFVEIMAAQSGWFASRREKKAPILVRKAQDIGDAVFANNYGTATGREISDVDQARRRKT